MSKAIRPVGGGPDGPAPVSGAPVTPVTPVMAAAPAQALATGVPVPVTGFGAWSPSGTAWRGGVIDPLAEADRTSATTVPAVLSARSVALPHRATTFESVVHVLTREHPAPQRP